MRASALVLLVVLSGACAREVGIAEFSKVRDNACKCEDAKCASGLVADIKHLRTLGSAPEGGAEEAVEAMRLLSEARACAAKLDPSIDKKLDEAF